MLWSSLWQLPWFPSPLPWFPLPSTLPRFLLYLFQVLDRRIRFLFQFFFFSFLLLFLSYGNCLLKVYLRRNIIFIHISDQIIIDGNLGKIASSPITSYSASAERRSSVLPLSSASLSGEA